MDPQQTDRQPLQTPEPQLSQAHQQAQANLDETQNLDVAISDMRTSHQPQRFRDFNAELQRPVTPDLTIRPEPELSEKAHPDNPIQTSFQRDALCTFRTYGRWGLTRHFYTIASGKVGAPWNHLVQDEQSGTENAMRLLMLLPDFIIESLIKNSLPYDYIHNEEVRKYVDTYMIIFTEYPGVYVNILTRATRMIGPQSMRSPYSGQSGRWLNSHEVERMLQRIDKYIDGEDDAANAAIDDYGRSAMGQTDSSEGRRFASSKEAVEIIREWMDVVRNQYCTGIDPGVAELGFIRCPCEVGWSMNVEALCRDQKANQCVRPIFGLINAITHLSEAQGGFDFPEVWQLTLFPLWERSTELAQVAEVLGSLLCASHCDFGGMTMASADFISSKDLLPDYEDHIWTEALRVTNKRLQDFKVIDSDLQHALKINSQLAKFQGLNELKDEVCEAEARSQEVTRALDEAKSKKARLRDELAKLAQEIDSQRHVNAQEQSDQNELTAAVAEFESAFENDKQEDSEDEADPKAQLKALQERLGIVPRRFDTPTLPDF